MLRFYYDTSASRILDDRLFAHDIKLLRACSIDTMYLSAYFYGKWDSTPEQLVRAAARLRGEGINAEILHVPFGHGGNALDPDDPDIPLGTGDGWRQRYTFDGRVMPTTTCPEEKCIRDTREVNDLIDSMGFRRIFLDDDCRLGMWGRDMQGCFCPECLARFSDIVGGRMTGHEIMTASDDIKEKWMEFQCANLTDYLVKTKPEHAELGLMVMHNGDRRHGIDIKGIRNKLPGTIFRVGECHFSEESMNAPGSGEEILRSVHTHMALAGGSANTWSESTVYPMGAMRPETWVRKIKLEISAGLRNIFLMSGTRFFTDDYWAALEKALPEMREMSFMPEPEHMIEEFLF